LSLVAASFSTAEILSPKPSATLPVALRVGVEKDCGLTQVGAFLGASEVSHDVPDQVILIRIKHHPGEGVVDRKRLTGYTRESPAPLPRKSLFEACKQRKENVAMGGKKGRL
jgi:hypothetical protein